jgi:hypothetical protein
MALYSQFAPDAIAMSWIGIELLMPMDGTFVTVEFAEDSFALFVGAQGDGAYVQNLNRSGIVTVTLQQGSPSNDLLSAKALEDRIFKTGFGPLLLKDLQGTTIVEAPIARLQRVPNISYADEIQGREWPFLCAEIIAHVGSNLVSF